MVQWLRSHIFNVGGLSSNFDQGTKIPRATGHNQKKKKRIRVNFCQDVLEPSLNNLGMNLTICGPSCCEQLISSQRVSFSLFVKQSNKIPLTGLFESVNM